ncbi:MULTISPECIES: PepSY domain-containing protein [Echinimonadaceae]|uniref:PepSY domain-containing protein n=2 Tax=Echinimonadaceae TaxID=3046600 RepID=A0A8J6QEY9_9GAMM|nr:MULTISPECIES: PepSY domain-containing protein [Echinimonadaceae]MBD1388404.1 PepSY domain-containing protein [Neiella litorisoli]MCM2679806.1 PepSY domain-containing protein [Echinimonas agarilytica]
MIRVIRAIHKWLMVVVGAQFLLWAISGLYMVLMNIHYVHGEFLSVDSREEIKGVEVTYSFDSLVRDNPEAINVELTMSSGHPIYRFVTPQGHGAAVDANTGERIPPVEEYQARQIAKYSYAGNDEISHVKLISDASLKPSEISARHLPVWQVTFDHYSAPTFYVSEYTGEIVTKRHSPWRIFDWMWRLHIMDYTEGENVSNLLFILSATTALAAALTGIILLVLRLRSSFAKEGL